MQQPERIYERLFARLETTRDNIQEIDFLDRMKEREDQENDIDTHYIE